ncbi:unnamed protein product [Pleuronectes platessa]|uniref:Uncharacterized protein n=1 Tax=Pleuronectes platessa TaxID=8262 RepID=A0A9N7W027_PLEPL|nr:unnamed protein product [Pleuronectes platessa]
MTVTSYTGPLRIHDYSGLLELTNWCVACSPVDTRGDGQIDIRHFVIALSTVHQPSKSMETLKLAFKMYESEEDGDVQEEDLATILEIMLGVKEVELSGLFLSLDRPDTERITYVQHPRRRLEHLDFNRQIILVVQSSLSCVAVQLFVGRRLNLRDDLKVEMFQDEAGCCTIK